MKFCPNCGNKIELEDAKFCYECGYKLPKLEKAKQEPKQEPKQETATLAGAVIEDGYLEEYTGNAETVVIPDGVDVIGECAFVDNLSIKHVIIPEGVVAIESDAFSGCKNLKTVELPSTLEEIGMGAFSRSGIESVSIPWGIKIIEDDVFSECDSLVSIVIPDTVKEIGENAFLGACAKSVKIPASVTEIGINALWGMSIEVDEANPAYKSVDGNLYSKDGTVLYVYNAKSPLVTFAVPNGVVRIVEQAFCYTSALKNLVVSSTVEVIEECAFEKCQQLASVSLFDGLKEIKPGAFEFCKSLSLLVIPKTVEEVGHFSGCDSLSAIYVGKGKKYTQLPSGVNVIEY